jgi:hypothetical protein
MHRDFKRTQNSLNRASVRRRTRLGRRDCPRRSRWRSCGATPPPSMPAVWVSSACRRFLKRHGYPGRRPARELLARLRARAEGRASELETTLAARPCRRCPRHTHPRPRGEPYHLAPLARPRLRPQTSRRSATPRRVRRRHRRSKRNSASPGGAPARRLIRPRPLVVDRGRDFQGIVVRT